MFSRLWTGPDWGEGAIAFAEIGQRGGGEERIIRYPAIDRGIALYVNSVLLRDDKASTRRVNSPAAEKNRRRKLWEDGDFNFVITFRAISVEL